MTTVTFTYGSPQAVKHLLSNTELASLVKSTLTILGPEIDNTGGPTQGQISVSLASAAFIAGNYITICFMPSDDMAGSGYPTIGTYANEAIQNYMPQQIGIKGSTAAQKANMQGVQIPNGKFKCFAFTDPNCPNLANSTQTI